MAVPRLSGSVASILMVMTGEVALASREMPADSHKHPLMVRHRPVSNQEPWSPIYPKDLISYDVTAGPR